MRKTYLSLSLFFFYRSDLREVNAQTQSAAAAVGGQIGPIDCRFRRTRTAGGQFRWAPTNSGQTEQASWGPGKIGAGEVGPSWGPGEIGAGEVGLAADGPDEIEDGCGGPSGAEWRPIL
jgi:hypothetical protein